MAEVVHALYWRKQLRRNRVFRDTLNPLDVYDDIELFERFRFWRIDILTIVEEIRGDLTFGYSRMGYMYRPNCKYSSLCDFSRLARFRLVWAIPFTLKQLHWLPVNYRIKFKLSTLTYRALAIHQPPYLASLLHFSNVPRQLRSSTSQQLSIPRTKLNLGKRAISVAAPIIWNELPTTLKYCESLASFRKNLKT